MLKGKGNGNMGKVQDFFGGIGCHAYLVFVRNSKGRGHQKHLVAERAFLFLAVYVENYRTYQNEAA